METLKRSADTIVTPPAKRVRRKKPVADTTPPGPLDDVPRELQRAILLDGGQYVCRLMSMVSTAWHALAEPLVKARQARWWFWIGGHRDLSHELLAVPLKTTARATLPGTVLDQRRKIVLRALTVLTIMEGAAARAHHKNLIRCLNLPRMEATQDALAYACRIEETTLRESVTNAIYLHGTQKLSCPAYGAVARLIRWSIKRRMYAVVDRLAACTDKDWLVDFCQEVARAAVATRDVVVLNWVAGRWPDITEGTWRVAFGNSDNHMVDLDPLPAIEWAWQRITGAERRVLVANLLRAFLGRELQPHRWHVLAWLEQEERLELLRGYPNLCDWDVILTSHTPPFSEDQWRQLDWWCHCAQLPHQDEDDSAICESIAEDTASGPVLVEAFERLAQLGLFVPFSCVSCNPKALAALPWLLAHGCTDGDSQPLLMSALEAGDCDAVIMLRLRGIPWSKYMFAQNATASHDRAFLRWLLDETNIPV